MKNKLKKSSGRVRINEEIRAEKVRAIGKDGENLNVMSIKDVIAMAQKDGLDVVEVSGKAVPPVVRIVEYGKYAYEQKKKQKEIKQKQHISETKTIQIKPTTGKNEINMRAKKIEEWLKEKHRVRIDLFLFGRYKYMDEKFLKGKLQAFLDFIPYPYDVAEELKKSPKGFSIVIQEKKGGGVKDQTEEKKKGE
ncbi:MAG: translation initiation factor IF-3 [Candidatus Campbellbacteria bacterium]|nr:translation initiation factor IF-3 [Candidatus Campbellbacteria bacterium]